MNKEIKHRTDVVGDFPNPAALLRLARSVPIEQHDEWEASDRRYFSSASMLEPASINTTIDAIEEVNLIPELTAAQTKTTDRHGDRKLHHSTGRHRERAKAAYAVRIGDEVRLRTTDLERTVQVARLVDLTPPPPKEEAGAAPGALRDRRT